MALDVRDESLDVIGNEKQVQVGRVNGSRFYHLLEQVEERLPTDLASDCVVRMVSATSGRPEDRHARTRKMQDSKSRDEITDGAKDQPELAQPRVGPFERDAVWSRALNPARA